MKIAQVAPLMESVPPRLYGGTERIVSHPETVETISAALTEVCDTLGLKGRADEMTELIAEHIVELAQQGIRTKTALVIRVMQEFKANPQ